MAKQALYTLLVLLSVSQLSSALQVTPNSPCSSVCRDSLDLDASDPNSSNTQNADITCRDADYSSPAGSKFKSCMTCLQTSTFSQGSESDIMWFLCTYAGSALSTRPLTRCTRSPQVHGCLLSLRLSECYWHWIVTMCYLNGLRSPPSQHGAWHPQPQ
jgi:hypothetical protein